jgi:hypothetical protein
MLEKPIVEYVSRDKDPEIPPDKAYIAPYSSIDISDSDDRVSYLNTHSQNARLGAQLLNILADQAIGPGLTLGKELRDRISGIAISDTRRAAPDLTYVLYSDEAVAETDPRHFLRKPGPFRELAHALATHDIVTAWFVGDELPSRSVVKITFDESLHAHKLSIGARFMRTIGWKSARYHINLTEIGAAASYHVEVSLPRDLELNEIGLLGEHYEYGWRGLPRRATQDDVRDPDGFFVRRAKKGQLGTLYLRNPNSRRVGTAWVKVRARRQGFLSGALVASLLTTGILVLYKYHARELVHDAAASSSSELLLVLPAILAAYIARPDDHIITTYLLRSARYVLMAVGCLPVLVALRLLTLSPHDKYPTHTLLTVLTPVTFASAASVAIFIASLIFPLPHTRPRYIVRQVSEPPEAPATSSIPTEAPSPTSV